MIETTLTLESSTTLECLEVDNDLLTTLATTLSTSLTAAHPINNCHYYYYYGDNYIQSLSEEQLANAKNLLKQKEVELEKPKQLVISKQS